MISSYADIEPYVTRDGSVIRELMHPDTHGNTTQSLAEAVVAPGTITVLHRHIHSEEIYHIIAGTGRMTLADTNFDVGIGDTICIAPGTAHCIENTGADDLHILCSCAPAYSHSDTELLE